MKLKEGGVKQVCEVRGHQFERISPKMKEFFLRQNNATKFFTDSSYFDNFWNEPHIEVVKLGQQREFTRDKKFQEDVPLIA